MANDFNLFIVDWPQLEKQFETSSLASIEESAWLKLSHAERSGAAGDFLGCLWESNYSIALSKITQFHGASESFHLWCFLGSTYNEIRRYLAEEDREVYDGLYLPFIAPWVDEVRDNNDVFELHDKLKQRLTVGGLCLALSPERCQKMQRDFRDYSFSRLVHEVLACRKFPPPLPGCNSFFHDMLDGVETQFGGLHRAYTELTEGWRILTQQANHRKWGIVAKYQI